MQGLRAAYQLARHCRLALLLIWGLSAAAYGQDPDGASSITVQTVGGGEPVSVECHVCPLAAAAFDFAFNPKTGELAAIETEFGRLWVYSPESLSSAGSAKPRTVSVGTRPVSIVWKEYRDRSYYVVICETGSELVVLDAATLEEVRRTRLPVRDLWRLWTSQNPEDPNVYFRYQLSRQGGVRKIDANTWEDSGEVVKPGVLMAVSADGRQLAVDPDGSSGSMVLSIDNGQIVHSRSSDCTLQSHQNVCVSDPHGQVLFIGQRFPFARTEVWRADLSRQVNSVDYAPLTVSPTRPWLVGYRRKGSDTLLVFAGYPSLGPLVELKYPGTPLHLQLRDQTVQLANWKAPRQFRVISDEQREQLLIAFNEQVTVVPLDDLNLPDGEVLRADVPLHASAETGTELRIPVQGLPAGADVKFRNLPEGARIEEGVLRWTPGDDQIGRYALEFDVTRDGETASQWIELVVDRPAFTLDGVNSRDSFIQVDPAGRRLLTAVLDATGQTELRLIDLETGEPVASAPLPTQARVGSVQFPAEDGGKLVVFHGTSVSLFSWPDLQGVTTYSIGRSFQNMVLVADQWAIGGSARGPVERWRLADGERVPFPQLIGRIHERTQNGAIAGISQEVIGSRLADGWISEGVFYDEGLETPRLLLRPWGFIRSERLDLTPLLRSRGDQTPQLTTVINAPNRLFVDNGRMQLSATTESVRFVPPEGQPDNYQIIKLDLWSLQTRQQVESTPLCFVQGRFSGRDTVRVFPAGSEAAVLVGDRLYLWSTPTSGPPDAAPSDVDAPGAEGPQFELRQSHLVVDAAGRTVFQHRVTGGAPPYRFEVQGPRANREVQSFPVDAETGDVSVDGAVAVEWVKTHLSAPLKQGDIDAIFDMYQGVADAEFEKIVGRPPQGVPVLLGMSVTATDSEGQQATLPYEFFIEVPRDDWAGQLQSAYDSQQQAIAQRREAQADEWRQRQEQEQHERELERHGLKPLEHPVPPDQILGGLALAALISLLALPLNVPISAVFLRAAFSLEMRLVLPYADELETDATWGRALLASLATQGGMLVVGFFIALYTQIAGNLALLAPLYTICLSVGQMLIAQWPLQALMVKLMLRLRWRRALRVSLYQMLIALLVGAACFGIFMALLAVKG